MKRRSRTSGKAGKAAGRREVTSRKLSTPPTAAPRRHSVVTTEETEIARLTRERDEALGQEAATAEILKALSRSTFDLQSVLESLLEKAVRLCDAERGLVYIRTATFIELRPVTVIRSSFSKRL